MGGGSDLERTCLNHLDLNGIELQNPFTEWRYRERSFTRSQVSLPEQLIGMVPTWRGVVRTGWHRCDSAQDVVAESFLCLKQGSGDSVGVLGFPVPLYQHTEWPFGGMWRVHEDLIPSFGDLMDESAGDSPISPLALSGCFPGFEPPKGWMLCLKWLLFLRTEHVFHRARSKLKLTQGTCPEGTAFGWLPRLPLAARICSSN